MADAILCWFESCPRFGSAGVLRGHRMFLPADRLPDPVPELIDGAVPISRAAAVEMIHSGAWACPQAMPLPANYRPFTSPPRDAHEGRR